MWVHLFSKKKLGWFVYKFKQSGKVGLGVKFDPNFKFKQKINEFENNSWFVPFSRSHVRQPDAQISGVVVFFLTKQRRHTPNSLFFLAWRPITHVEPWVVMLKKNRNEWVAKFKANA